MAVVFSLTACKQGVDLGAVRSFAATVEAAEPSYAAIANDYYTVCLEQAGWQKLIDFGNPSSPENQADKIEFEKITKTLGTVGSIALTSEREALIDDANGIVKKFAGTVSCGTISKQNAEDWNRINGVVTGYVEALGAVAGGQKPTDFGFGNVTGKISSLTGAQGSALSNFLNALANEIFDSKRRSAIANTAPMADGALQTLVTLQKKAAKEYKFQLNLERDRINSFYRSNFSVVPPGLGRVQIIADEVQWKAKLDDVDKRSAAADDYVASVDSIAAVHASLIGDLENNRFDRLYAIAASFVAEFKPKVAALNKAFK